jgi:hypothetical protein
MENIFNIGSNPSANAFLIRCFRQIKDDINIKKLNDEDKESYYDCCKMLDRYEKYMKELDVRK